MYFVVILDLVLNLPNPESVDLSGSCLQSLRMTIQTWIQSGQASWEQLISALMKCCNRKAVNSLRERVTNIQGTTSGHALYLTKGG